MSILAVFQWGNGKTLWGNGKALWGNGKRLFRYPILVHNAENARPEAAPDGHRVTGRLPEAPRLAAFRAKSNNPKAMALYQAMMNLPTGEVPDLAEVKLPPALAEAAAQMALADRKDLREQKKIPPPSEYHVPQGEPPDLSHMEYAYWLGFLYRCESLMHEESSHMVYGAFDEPFMWKYYQDYLKKDMAEKDLAETAITICKDIDTILVTQIWAMQEL